MDIHDRLPNRLADYDYGQEGCYFITLCTHGRARLFEMEPACVDHVGNGLCAVPCPIQNQIIHTWLSETGNKFPNMAIDAFVIMPDHIHLFITITERHAGRSLPDIMRFFKTMTTNAYIRSVKSGYLPPFDRHLWQKSYYDHVIRNEQDYAEVWEYIRDNPSKWQTAHET